MFGKMRMTFSRRRTSWMSRCGTLGRSESLAILLRQSQHGCCFNLSTKKPPRSDGERWLDAALCRNDFALLVEHDIPVEPSRPTLLPEAPSKPPVFSVAIQSPLLHPVRRRTERDSDTPSPGRRACGHRISRRSCGAGLRGPGRSRPTVRPAAPAHRKGPQHRCRSDRVDTSRYPSLQDLTGVARQDGGLPGSAEPRGRMNVAISVKP
jgi:hypothetical protein